MGKTSPAIGRCIETRAADHLSALGVTIIARNVRRRCGEIDLIGREGATVLFIEVRKRSSARFGGAAASITGRKQARIIAAARAWLGGRTPLCRFDAILVDGPDGSIEWLRDAFRCDGL